MIIDDVMEASPGALDETSQGRPLVGRLTGLHAIMMDTPRFHLPLGQRRVSL